MLKLYMHPLSSYCHKVLIAFHENAIPFEVKRVDEPEIDAELKRLWPVGRFPILFDTARDRLVPESTIIIEYLAQHYPGPVNLVPEDPDKARQVRLADRFFDHYLHTPVQRFVFDRWRPEDKRDAYGVDEARAMYGVALDMLEFYGEKMLRPFRATHPIVAAYLDRLLARPSYARTLVDAQPFMHMLPQ
jgi:glutathione S-transferase